MGSPSSLVIATLPGAPVQMSLTLQGRALPYQGLELEGTMRAELTWYPGNGVASVQMLGAEEKGTTLKGMWKDKFIKSTTDEGLHVDPSGIALFQEGRAGAGVQVEDVFDLSQKVERMRLAGQPVELRWDRHVRHGLLSRFKQKWDRIEDMEWEMEFLWVSRGEAQTPTTIVPQGGASDLANALSVKLQSLQSFLTFPPFPVVEDFVAACEALVASISSAVGQMQAAVQQVVDQVLEVQSSAERVLAAVEEVKSSALGLIATIEQFPPAQLINTLSLEAPTLGELLRVDVWSRSIKETARQLAADAASQGDALQASTRQEDLLGSFTARGPTDLRDVSTAFYGTPNEWRRLMLFNKLETSALQAGDLVLVPRLTSKAA